MQKPHDNGRIVTVSLQEAPLHFFKPEAWSKMRAHNLARHRELYFPDLFPSQTDLEEAKQSGNDEFSERLSTAFISAEQQTFYFVEELRAGKLSATGYGTRVFKRRGIGADLWSELRPNFISGEATGVKYYFDRVEITGPSKQIQAQQQACIDWLKQFHPRSLNKQYRWEEAQKLYPQLTKTDFQACFTEAYDLTRGAVSKDFVPKSQVL